MSTQPHWIPEDAFGTRLVILRRQLDLSVEEIAARCGLKPATWSTWERGASPRNQAAVVAAVALAVGVDRDWLMWGGPLASGPDSPDGLPRLDSNQKPPGLRYGGRCATDRAPMLKVAA